MIHVLGAVGGLAGTLLLVLLMCEWRTRALAIWPPRAAPSWQSPLFWGLFRTLNVSALSLAALDWQPAQSDDAVRAAAAVLALLGGVVYLRACLHLGRVNLYGGATGLVTSGVYAWSRNPQYALAMPSYAALAVACQSLPMALLAAMLIGVFVLMALCEEPWLEATYGAQFAGYRADVARFYSVRRVVETLQQRALRRMSPP